MQQILSHFIHFTLQLFHHFEVQLSNPEEPVSENSHPENLPLNDIDDALHHLNCDFHQGIPRTVKYVITNFNIHALSYKSVLIMDYITAALDILPVVQI